jgi:hypothetical protein
MTYRYSMSKASAETFRAVRADLADLEGIDPLTIPRERIARRIVSGAADFSYWQGQARQGAASGHLGYRASRLTAVARELTRDEG